jgi:hypothetical protein
MGFGAIERNFWRRDPEDSRIIKIKVSVFDSKRWKLWLGVRDDFRNWLVHAA